MNLIDDPWIPCRFDDGTTRELGIQEALLRAREVTELSGDVPTQVFAVMRLLIAFLSRATQGPSDEYAWRDLWRDGPSVEVIATYGDRFRHRFELLHPEYPFMQVATLQTAKGEFSPLSKIIADVPDGHQFFTTRGGEGLSSLTPAEAARWLLNTHAFDPSGIKSGAIGDARVKGGKGYPIGTGWAGNLGGLFVEGKNLWETLLLNLIPLETNWVTRVGDDSPVWEREQQDAAPTGLVPTGPVSLYTWQSRRIRLIEKDGVITSVLVANGDPLEPFNKNHLEPMTAWRRSTPQQRKHDVAIAYMPRTHTPGRALWRGLSAILPTAASAYSADDGQDNVTALVVQWASYILDTMSDSSHVQIRAIGIEYGSNNSVISEIIDDRLNVPLAVLSEVDPRLVPIVLRAVDRTEREAVFALKNLASNLVRAAGADSDKILDGRRDRAAEMAYSALDPIFREWLASLGKETQPIAALDDYSLKARRCLLDIGRELVEEASPQALVGRLVAGPKKDSEPRRLSAPLAEAWFRSAVFKALPTSVNKRDGAA